MNAQNSSQKPKIAIFHAFFKADCKGGGEKLVLELRERLQADMWVGAIGLETWGKQLAGKDYFATKLWNERLGFDYLHEDLKLPIIKQIYRQLQFLFSPKIPELAKYDVIIFSGNVGFVPRRVKNFKAKKILYCHTPPRPFTDQFEARKANLPTILRPFFTLAKNFIINQYQKDCQTIDTIVVNSENIKNRLEKYCGIKADKVVYPPTDTTKFKFIADGDYYLSFARLENLKRIKVLVSAFSQMPDKKLVLCSGGPLKDWVLNEIETKQIKNIEFKGLVSDEELKELIGKCLAGIYIPIDEDFGMVQVELMSAGKPVIGSAEGGLLETVIDGKTGILIQTIKTSDFGELENKTLEYLTDQEITQNLIQVITNTPVTKLQSMRKDCEIQAQNFSQTKFFEGIQEVINA